VKITIRIHRDKVWEELYLPIYLLIKKYKWGWQTIGAIVSLVSGILSPLIGAILDLIVSYTSFNYGKAILYKICILLYIVTIPLLMLGSHFLDLLEKKDREICFSEEYSQDRRIKLQTKPNTL
jgi:hypothetical protein